MKILVLPDIHGRNFWVEPSKHVDEYDKVIFLGDYFDPYPFEGNTVEDAIANFEGIIDFKKANEDKVVLLLGNHDMPYFSKEFYGLSSYHCRHSTKFHNTIAALFDENREWFKIAHVEDDVLFTHAGCTSEWLIDVFTDKYPIKGQQTIDDLVFSLNNLLNTSEGLKFLYRVGNERGGWDKNGSCIWADVNELLWDYEKKADEAQKVHFIHDYKQVFGHTLQAYEQKGKILYGHAIEEGKIKMLDNASAYILDTEKFEVQKI